MGLLTSDMKRLDEAGFTRFEIGMLAEDLRVRPQVFDLDTGTWQDVLAKRKAWVQRELRAGKTMKQIRAKANARYFVGREASVWDFVRAEYHPVDKLDDYREAQRKRAQERIEKPYGKRIARRKMP